MWRQRVLFAPHLPRQCAFTVLPDFSTAVTSRRHGDLISWMLGGVAIPGSSWWFCNAIYMAVCQNLVPLVNIKIAGKWMFIPLKMVLIGIDPYPYLFIHVLRQRLKQVRLFWHTFAMHQHENVSAKDFLYVLRVWYCQKAVQNWLNTFSMVINAIRLEAETLKKIIKHSSCSANFCDLSTMHFCRTGRIIRTRTTHRFALVDILKLMPCFFLEIPGHRWPCESYLVTWCYLMLLDTSWYHQEVFTNSSNISWKAKSSASLWRLRHRCQFHRWWARTPPPVEVAEVESRKSQKDTSSCCRDAVTLAPRRS
jgi:hypothetical protein